MSQEQNFDLMSWWDEQSFQGKELFTLNENGDITLKANNTIPERVIANVSPENADAVLKNLCEQFSEVESKIREIEVEWLAAEDKLKLTDKVAQAKQLLHTATAIGDYLKPGLLVHDWEHTIYKLTEEIYAAKLKLAEQAESLADSDQWKETAQAFKDIADMWKQTGHIDKGRNDSLWNRIEAARRKFMDRKQEHHKEEEKDMLVNLDLKLDVVERAEVLAGSEEWRKTSDAFTALTDEWKSIGHTIHKKNEELWQRFITAKKTFFERKREHSGRIQQEQEHNFALKEDLVARAEALKNSRDWNATTQAYAALMDEWKKTGRVPKEKGDELWERFTAAQDVFFEAKKTHFSHQKSTLEHNYTLKKELFDRAERLKNSSNWSEVTNEMVDLLEQWKKIGPIPRSYGDTMWEEFNAARKHFFARKDASREQRKQYAEAQKVQRVAQAKGLVGKLELEIKEEEDKIADFREGLNNITPGKKAGELKAHLEQLITEGAENIKQLQRRLEQAINDLKVPEPKPSPQTKGTQAQPGDAEAGN